MHIKPLTLTNILLLTIAVPLIVLAMRPLRTPEPVHAQAPEPYPFFIEPGTYLLRSPDGSNQTYGKVVIDLTNGQIWGFPTLGPQPFPVNAVETKPQTTHPFALGRFAFEDTNNSRDATFRKRIARGSSG